MTAMFEGYDADGPAYDEMFEGDELREPYSALESSLAKLAELVTA